MNQGIWVDHSTSPARATIEVRALPQEIIVENQVHSPLRSFLDIIGGYTMGPNNGMFIKIHD